MNQIYVRNRQTLGNYKHRIVGKPYAVKLEPYQRKSMEWDSQYPGFGRAHGRMMSQLAQLPPIKTSPQRKIASQKTTGSNLQSLDPTI